MDIGVDLVKGVGTSSPRAAGQGESTEAVVMPNGREDEREAVAPALLASPPSREELTAIVSSIQSATQAIRRDLSFSLDEEAGGAVVVKVMDSNGELIRQIPSEEILRLRGQLEEVRSLLFSTTA